MKLLKSKDGSQDGSRDGSRGRSPHREESATQKSVMRAAATGVQFCGAQAVTCGGRTFVPCADLAYVEFFLSYAYPVVTVERTGIHPQVVANSFRSMENKVFNLNHVMQSYDPDHNERDYILGSIEAVEFPAAPEGGWKITEAPPGIRCVASMFKAAQKVESILTDWFEGRTPLGEGQWTVSMENTHHIADCGFLVRLRERYTQEDQFPARGTNPAPLKEFWINTPSDLKALGLIYVPTPTAPVELLKCLNSKEDDERDGNACTRVLRDYLGCDVQLLIGGLDGRITYNGVGLTPLGKEPTARVRRMLASVATGGGELRRGAAATAGGEVLAAEELLAPLRELAELKFE